MKFGCLTNVSVYSRTFRAIHAWMSLFVFLMFIRLSRANVRIISFNNFNKCKHTFEKLITINKNNI